MTVSVSDVQEYVGASGGDAPTTDLLTSCLAQAEVLVTEYNQVWDTDTCAWVASSAPDAIVDRAVVEVTADLFNRRNAPNGVLNQQFIDGVTTTAVRINRDPMLPAYPLLRRWVGVW